MLDIVVAYSMPQLVLMLYVWYLISFFSSLARLFVRSYADSQCLLFLFLFIFLGFGVSFHMYFSRFRLARLLMNEKNARKSTTT